MYADSQLTSPAMAGRWPAARARRQFVLGVILAASVVSTAAHYTHNFVEIEQYPQYDWQSAALTQAAILVSWPLLTAIGLIGYWLYRQRRDRAAHTCLVIYSLTGLITPIHFLKGSPDIAPLWYATIFTDALAGLAVLAFVGWSALTFVRVEPGVPT